MERSRQLDVFGRLLQERLLASTAQVIFELVHGEKFRLTGVNLCLARGQHFAMPFWGSDVLLFPGKRGPKPFHGLKPLSVAQTSHFLLQFKNTHGSNNSSRGPCP